MRKGLCSFFALLMLVLPVCGRTAAADAEYAAVLMEAQTGMVIDGVHADQQMPAGSQTKLMTVYLTAEAVAARRLTMDTMITVPPAAEGTAGATVWLRSGEQMSVQDLLKAVIIGNANDACAALAYAVSGSEDAFVMDMNAEAFTLGMRDTVFTDAAGLSAENRTTPRDLALLCRALLRHECLTPMFTQRRDFLRDGATELVSENELTRGYSGLLGLKAGHGDASGYTLCAAAERDHMRMIAVVLGSADADERFRIAKNLLADGFSGYYVTTPDFSPEFIKPLRVHHGISSAVQPETGALCSIAAPKGEAFQTVIWLPEYVEAPVKKGQAIGSAAFYCGDSLLCEVSLTAAEEIPRRGFRETLALLLGALA